MNHTQNLKLSGLLVLTLCCFTALAQERKAPSYPLITHNTYFSIWSNTDKLNESNTAHWTGKDQSLLGLISVDGNVYRFMGAETINYKTVLPATDEAAFNVHYTEQEPKKDWNDIDFDAKNWKVGQSPIGDNPKGVKTLWNSDNIWVRRTFELSSVKNLKNLFLKLNHDDNVEVFLNGKRVYKKQGWTNSFELIPLGKVASLKNGKNVLAIHLMNSAGGRYLDFGLVEKIADKGKPMQLAKQESVDLNATQTIYKFNCGAVDLKLTFTSPLLMNDLGILARPVSYVSYLVNANDGKNHQVKVFLGASTDIAVDQSSQKVNSKQYSTAKLSILKAGTVEQPILQKTGDDRRIDWGYFCVAVPKGRDAVQFISSQKEGVSTFVNNKTTSTTKSGTKLSLNTVLSFGSVGQKPIEKMMELGYDEIYSVEYFNTKLRPWWNTSGKETIESQLTDAYTDYATVLNKCDDFNKSMYAEALSTGGKKYADLCVLAYRQSIAAHTLVKSPDGEILWLSKENNSGGFINTVDVTYPSAPLYLIYNPELLQGMLNGIFYFSESGKYPHPWAAHDLGTYPLANGLRYGEPMPVEESGNMIILTAAIAKAQGNAKYAEKYWKT
ncbi:MAG: DUF4965 domain-containing protein, partial [Pedobacter sp.]|nr:DUF4965 domain-containing protein [Pedobacter sp.]